MILQKQQKRKKFKKKERPREAHNGLNRNHHLRESAPIMRRPLPYSPRLVANCFLISSVTEMEPLHYTDNTTAFPFYSLRAFKIS